MSAAQEQIQVHLPDGSIKEFPAGATPFQVAESISPRLAAASVVARIQPLNAAATASSGDKDSTDAMYAKEDAQAERLVDLCTPLHESVKLQLLTEKDPDALKVVRHSAAH